ncbi:predicted protein [Aspergillus terreus NIH2624]|uniref:Uncharacterized protein n=1 Tax=Aspergillus terreus (strain NIH 2624 / FGSC A1156) TaxID=341663 RepID=Q0CRR3_ASPTN|nr:uncharacterized protein ATEG_03621 [Aspergillus terreus NIH2624]EAU35423.1 predicted protein [Aspergillus terreus NIH2624]
MRLSAYSLLLTAFAGIVWSAPTDGGENELMKRQCVGSANAAQPATAIVNVIATMDKGRGYPEAGTRNVLGGQRDDRATSEVMLRVTSSRVGMGRLAMSTSFVPNGEIRIG